MGCRSVRQDQDETPVFRGEVGPLLGAKCARCHAGDAPAGGWRADSYVGAIGCTSSGKQAAARDANAPLLTALDRPDHAGFVSAEERAILRAWLMGGAPSLRSGVHSVGFVDPRSRESHGQFLRAQRYAPMLDTSNTDACGRCHEGAPARPTNVAFGAEGATACTTCHTDPAGPLGCGTCHGGTSEKGTSGKARSYPPRDRCFFPDDPPSVAHAAHVESSPSRASGLACSACHPTPLFGKPEGTHANGNVEVWLDYGLAGREARFDPTSKRCTGSCHSRGGARPEPTWSAVSDGARTCGDCHSSPPPAHYKGTCTSCHKEADATGTALTEPVLHVNGKVDLGDGSGQCGACHGRANDPWPTTGAHAAHASPKGARAVVCETCHAVPEPGARHPLGTGGATVRLAGLASRGGRRPTWDPATKTCAGTYCHEGSGGAVKAPIWTQGPPAGACGSCHALPPPPPHAQSNTCGSVGCHVGTTTATGELSANGRAVHVDGMLQSNVP